MINPSEVTFVVPIFNLKEDRINNLKFVIPYIQKTGCRILVTEQTDKDESELSNIINEFNGVEHVLFKTPEKRFHKSGIINYAVFNHVDTKYVWVNDVDFYMRYGDVFKLKWEEKFIQPYDVAKKLNSFESTTLLRGNKVDINFSDPSVKYISMYGALSFIFDVDEFIKIGAMDESIYGWGYEDVELSKRVSEKYSVQKMQYKGIHLWHPTTLDYLENKNSFNINSYFDKIYCINLENRIDRWNLVKKQFEENAIFPERFSAVHASNVSDEDFYKSNPNNITGEYASNSGIPENKFAIGCLRSHLNVIRDAKKNNYKKILIFEDDVYIGKNFKRDIKKIRNLNSNWKLVYLGASQFDWSKLNDLGQFYNAKNTYGTFAYAIDCSAYDELIDLFKTEKKSVDNLLIEFQRKWKKECYVFNPNIVISEVRDSDIRIAIDLKKYSTAARWNLKDFVIPSKSINKIKFDDGIKNLVELDRIFLKRNAEYWISCGTLLGFHRGDGFISHDTDIDLCVCIDDLNKELLEEFIKNDFKIIKKFGRLKEGFQIALFKREIKVDLFFYYKKDGWGYHSVYSNFSDTDCLRHDYVFSEFELVDREYFGHMFSVPKDTEKYIIEQYGEKYKEKVVDWKYAESPKNIVHRNQRVKYIDTDKDMEDVLYRELNENVTLLIKSFMRKECVVTLIKSIRKQYKFIKIIVVDDSEPKLNFDFDENIKTYNIPFDLGLSAGRNYGVSKIDTPYFVLLDDDFVFNEYTDLVRWFDIMKKSDLDLLGADVLLNNNKTNFFGNLSRSGSVLTYKNERHAVYEDYKTCDLVLNFFIAKTKKIIECKWDDWLKLSEHTAYFFKYKNLLKIGYTEKISILHEQKQNDSYALYRKRARQFLLYWMKEMGINKIINFEGTVTEIINGEFKITQNSLVNKKYWDTFYSSQSLTLEESSFAKFTLNYINKNNLNGKIIDAGCGNGRDLMYFLKNKMDAIGVDIASSIENEKVIIKNITDFDYTNYDIIYLRFVVHTMPESELDVLLKQIKNTAKTAIIFIETRSVRGVSEKEKEETMFKSPVGEKHFRMLYSQKYLTNKLSKFFEVLYVNESNGMAPFKEEDPVCIRYILKNNS